MRGKGWTAAGDLALGDELLDPHGNWLPVTDLLATGVVEPVYNARIADYHTYFTGRSADGAWAVWAHNACERHHPAFKYVLRGINKHLNGTTKLTELRQNLVKIEQVVHRKLHSLFDKMDGGKYARYMGWKNILDLLGRGKVTPSRLFDKMVQATKKALKGMPELNEALGELNRIRGLLNIP